MFLKLASLSLAEYHAGLSAFRQSILGRRLELSEKTGVCLNCVGRVIVCCVVALVVQHKLEQSPTLVLLFGGSRIWFK